MDATLSAVIYLYLVDGLLTIGLSEIIYREIRKNINNYGLMEIIVRNCIRALFWPILVFERNKIGIVVGMMVGFLYALYQAYGV